MATQSLLAKADTANQAGEYTRALDLVSEFLAEEPDDPRGVFLLGTVAANMKDKAFAYQCLARAVALAPERAEPWTNLGRTLDEMGYHPEAFRAYSEALQRDPTLREAQANRVACLVNLAQFRDALALADRVLAADPANTEALVSRGYALVGLGRYAEGWPLYAEGVGRNERRKLRRYRDEPVWTGEEVDTLIVYGEQGLGDCIYFAQAVREARARAKHLILDVQPKLAGLLRRSFLVRTEETGLQDTFDWPFELPRIDASCALSQLMPIFRSTRESFTGRPFLVADRERRLQWKALMEDWGGIKPKIGLAWTGGAPDTGSRARNKALEWFLPLLDALPGAVFVDLEYKDRHEDIARLKGLGYHIHSWPRATQSNDLDDVAGLVAELDLVVSVPTTVVHVAGALGVPCLCITHESPHCFFGAEGERMDAYQSVRLSRPPHAGWVETALSMLGSKRI